MSFCVYTVLYTLEDRDPEKNEYVQMFFIWLSQIVKSRAAKSCALLVDSRTFDFLETNLIYNKMLEKMPLNLTTLVFPPPKTYMDGMKMKFTPFDYEEDYLMYLDLDIIVLKPLYGLIEHAKNYEFYVQLEHELLEHEYTDEMTEEEKSKLIASNVINGLSSGKFIVGSKLARDQIFSNIIAHMNKTTRIYNTVEQPAYNRVLFLESSNIKIATIDKTNISENLRNYADSTIIIDYYGEACNGKIHLQKMIDFIAYQNLIESVRKSEDLEV